MTAAAAMMDTDFILLLWLSGLVQRESETLLQSERFRASKR